MALRTLRQRPTVVGRTDDGATVYEIRSVRLVLTPGSSHFRRLVPCAKCDREVPGSSIQSVFDLDRPANSVFCDRCSKSSHSPGPEIGRIREDGPAPAAPPVVMKGAVEARRLGPAESQVAEVRSPAPAPAEKAGELQRFSEQVADLMRRQNAELAKVSASVAQVRAEMRELGESNLALARGQRDLDQRIIELESHPAAEIETTSARALAEVRESLAAIVDATAQSLHAALADGLDQLRSEIASLQRRVDEAAARSEMEEIAEANRQLAQVQGDLDEKLRQLAARPGPDPEAAELRAALAEGLDLLRAEIAGIEARIGDESAALIARLETQRAELTQALHDVVQETLMAVAEPLRDLTSAREDFERRLESLQRMAREGEQQREALAASADAGASRHHALEQRINATAQQVARLIELQTQTVPAPPGGPPVPGGIMESLERQLRAAEVRLLRTTSEAGGE